MLINKFFIYGMYDGNNIFFFGDIIIVLNEFFVGCDGDFWIDKDDVKDNFSIFLFVFFVFYFELMVCVLVNIEKIWKGFLGVKYC